LLAFIKAWNDSLGGSNKLDVTAIGKIEKYVRMSLGYSGSQWEGCIGDLSVQGLGGNTSTGGAESHFSSYLTLILNGTRERNIVKFILGTMMGVNGNGTETGKPTYWSVFDMMWNDEDMTSTVRRRHLMEGARLTMPETIPTEYRPVIVVPPVAIAASEGGPNGPRYVCVRRDVPASVLSSSVEISELKVLTLKLCDLLEHCTLLPGEEGELILTAFRQDADSCKFFERIGFEYYHGGKVPKSRLSVHDILVGPGEESALELITMGEPSEHITLLVKSKRERRRKSVSEGAQEDRDSGARVPGNGRSHCHVAETTNLEAADVARPTDVQKRRAGANKTVSHRMNRPGLPSSPPFSPAESAAVGAATGSKKEYIYTELPAKRARQEPGISQRGDESEWF